MTAASQTASRPPQARRLIGNLVALAVSLLLAAVGLEVALRLYFYGDLAQPSYGINIFQPHPTRGWANRPGARGMHQELDFRVPVTVNAHGLRGPEFAPQPDGRRQRIMIVADSSMFGSGARDDENVPAQLQRILGDGVEVLNLSVNAYSTVQELLWLREEGLAWKPDLVLLAFAPGNDVQTNVVELQTLFQRTLRRPYASLDASDTLKIDTSAAQQGQRRTEARRNAGFLGNLVLVRVAKFVARKLGIGAEAVDPNIFLGWPYLTEFLPQHTQDGRTKADYDRLWAQAWRVSAALIGAMAQDVRSGGARFAVFVPPSKIQGDPEHRQRIEQAFPGARIDPLKMDREIKALADRLGFAALDITTPILAAAAKGGAPLYFNFEDEHWTPHGNRIAAEALAAQLQQAGLVK
jgi:hypothetical protein